MPEENPEHTGLALLRSVTITSETTALVRELGEVALDTLLEDENLRRVPVFGGLYAVGSAIASMPQKVFAQKVGRFLSGVGHLEPGRAEAWLRRMSDQGTARKLSEWLVVVLDSLNSAAKAAMLGKLFRGLLLDRICVDDFRRLSNMLDASYESDLTYLVSQDPATPLAEDGDEIRQLIMTGFVHRPLTRFGGNIRQAVQPELTDLSRVFVELMRE